MELFFLKKQVADETSRLNELKKFFDQNVVDSGQQELKKASKINEIEKYQ
jgi:hypothetical protein